MDAKDSLWILIEPVPEDKRVKALEALAIEQWDTLASWRDFRRESR